MAKSLKQASKAAINRNKVAQLDNFGTDPNEVVMGDELSVIENVVGDFIKRVHANIEAEGLEVTGKIADIEIVPTDTGVEVTAYPWLIYQDKGVNGSVKQLYNTPFSFNDKKPPIEEFKAWVQARHIGDGSDSVAYAVRESVFQEGFKPRNIYTKEIPQLAEELAKQIAEFSAKNIVLNLR